MTRQERFEITFISQERLCLINFQTGYNWLKLGPAANSGAAKTRFYDYETFEIYLWRVVKVTRTASRSKLRRDTVATINQPVAVKISTERACKVITPGVIVDQAAVTLVRPRVVDHVANYTDSPTPRGCSAFTSRSLSPSHPVLSSLSL